MSAHSFIYRLSICTLALGIETDEFNGLTEDDGFGYAMEVRVRMSQYISSFCVAIQRIEMLEMYHS